MSDNAHLDLGVLHVQTQTSNQVLADLSESLSKSGNMQILIGDFNQTTETSEAVVNSRDPRLVRLDTDPTYPRIFADTGGW